MKKDGDMAAPQGRAAGSDATQSPKYAERVEAKARRVAASKARAARERMAGDAVRQAEIIEQRRFEADAYQKAQERKRQEILTAQERAASEPSPSGVAYLETQKSAARQKWLQSGGSVDEFERAWPGLRLEFLKKQVLDAEEQKRAAAWHLSNL